VSTKDNIINQSAHLISIFFGYIKPPAIVLINNCLSDTCRALAAATAIAAVRLPAKLSFSSGPLLYHDDANQQVRGGARDSKGSKRPSNKIHSQHDISYHIQR